MIFASDLDRTLIYSNKSMGDHDHPVKLIETLDGKEISFMTLRAIELLKQLMSKITFVPVTTRTLAQYKRIRIFANELKPSYAITSNGAVILKDGKPIDMWTTMIKTKIQNESLSIEEVYSRFKEIEHANWILRKKSADGFFWYNIIDPEQTPMDELKNFAKWLDGQGWVVSLQGRKLYFVPKSVNKRDAVKYLQQLLHDTNLISAGDSKLDIPLLEAANLCFIPKHGEIWEEGIHLPASIQTQNSGILASEDILLLIHEQLREQEQISV